MRKWVAGLALLLLVACSSSTPELKNTAGFTFSVNPSAGTASVVATGGGASTQAVDGQRTLLPGEDLELTTVDYTFLPGNMLAIDAVFKNVSDQTFTNLSFSQAAGSDNIVSSTEPGLVARLEPSESTGPLRFTVQHKGQPFTYAVEATATVGETGGADCTDPVNIPDDVLRKEVRLQLQLSENSEITCSDLLRLTKFRYEDIDVFITNLEGLQYAVNLTSLEIGGGFLTDISQVSSLTKLTRLGLGGNEQIRDITPLGGLADLKYLDLASNAIEDISALGGLVNLEDLFLSRNAIKDISPLSNLTRLERLTLGRNDIVDIAALSGLVNLNRLGLDDNFVTDIGSLVTNTGLGDGDDRIDLELNCLNVRPGSQTLEDVDTVEDRNPDVQNVEVGLQKSVEECPQLPPPPPAEGCNDPVNIPSDRLKVDIRTALRKSSADDITCVDLANLTTLEAGFEEPPFGDEFEAIESLKGLQYAYNLTSLKFLVPPANPSPDLLAPLSELENLIRLEMREPFLAPADPDDVNLEPLSGLSSLKSLNLPRAAVSDVGPLAGLFNLRELGLRNAVIEDYSPLQNLSSLRVLDLSNIKSYGIPVGAEITDISFLEGLSELRFLDLSSNPITDISSLSGLINLSELGLSETKVTDLNSLSDLTNLSELYLASSEITDISSLSNLTNLSTLNLRANFIRDLSPLVANTGLGNDEDLIILRDNCLDTSAGSQASQDVATVEARNPSVDNVDGFEDQKSPSSCS